MVTLQRTYTIPQPRHNSTHHRPQTQTLPMTRRYYVPDLPIDGGPLALPDEEAQHAARVMRVSPGDSLTLFNGQGYQTTAAVTSSDRRRVHVQADPASFTPSPLPLQLSVAVAIPKGDRARWLVEKLTELGVHQLIPLLCQHAQYEPSSGTLQKLRRNVIEACKQCSRNNLMDIADPASLTNTLQQTPTEQPRWLAHPGGSPIASLLAFTPPQSPPADSLTTTQLPSQLLCLIGPEGGFSAAEVATARELDAVLVGLGPTILRIETAAIALVAGILAQPCWLSPRNSSPPNSTQTSSPNND